MATEPTTSPSRPSRASLADSIYEILFHQIAEGQIAANAPVNIDSLAREFDVSPTPIREALARLESTGLVVREALRGYRAAPLFDTDQLLKMMDARAVIEPPLTSLACSNADREFISTLRSNVTAMDNLDEADGLARYRDTDEAFHRLLAARADNPFLERAFESLEAHVHRFRLFGPLGRSDLDDARREHALIVDAIETGDPARSADAMRDHINCVRQRAISDRNQLPDT